MARPSGIGPQHVGDALETIAATNELQRDVRRAGDVATKPRQLLIDGGLARLDAGRTVAG